MLPMTLPTLELPTDKGSYLGHIEPIVLRQTDLGLTLTATIVNADGTAHDLTGLTVNFNENKDGGRFIADNAVDVVDATNGRISYKLNHQCYTASGLAWFDLLKSSEYVDSTVNFSIYTMGGLDASDNQSYTTDFATQLNLFKSLIEKSKTELNAEITIAKAAISDLTSAKDSALSEVQTLTESVNTATAKVNDLSSKVDKNNATVSNLSDTVKTTQASVEADSQAVDEAKKSIDGLTGKVNSTQQAIDTNKNAISSNTEAINTLNGKVDSNSKQINDISGKVNYTQQTIDDNKTAIVNNTKKVDDLTDKVNTAQQLADSNKTAIANNAKAVDTLTATVSGNTAKIKSTADIVDTLKTQVAALTVTSDKLKDIDFTSFAKTSDVSKIDERVTALEQAGYIVGKLTDFKSSAEAQAWSREHGGIAYFDDKNN